MKKILFLFAALCLAQASTIKATGTELVESTDLTAYSNVIYVAPATIDPNAVGSEIDLSICMINTAEIRGFQFDMYLPDGMTAVKTPKGKYTVSLNTARLPEDDEHTLTVAEQSDGAIRFLCGSQYDETFTGKAGEIASIKVNIEGLEEGEYPITLKAMKLSETDISKYYEVAEVVTTLTIVSAKVAIFNLTYFVDGALYTSYEVEYGAYITPEPDPVKEGYTFSGWSEIPETMPDHDVIVTGSFTRDDIVVDNAIYEETEGGVVLTNGAGMSDDVVIPNAITVNRQRYPVVAVGEDAFKNNTDITSVTIPEGIVEIGASAFDGCTNLTNIVIGADVVSIDERAFANIVPSDDDFALTVSCYAVNVPETATNAFENTPIDKARLLVEDDSVSDYSNAEPWNGFGTILGFNEESGIDVIWTGGNSRAKVYTLDGKLLKQPRKGVNIVRMSDGNVRKVVVK